jgi:hypothetical protein
VRYLLAHCPEQNAGFLSSCFAHLAGSALAAAGVVAYFAGFIAAVELALSKLAY